MSRFFQDQDSITKKISITADGYESLLEAAMLFQGDMSFQPTDSPSDLSSEDGKNYICPITDMEIDYSGIYLTMPLADSTLKEFYRTRKVRANTFTEHFKDLVQGLAFLHSKNIFHADIKPSNLLIFNGQVKYADFGSSIINFQEDILSTSLRECKKSLYTKLYRPPEVWAGYICDKSDIWALGVTLYELRYGKLPFKVKKKLEYEELDTEGDFLHSLLCKMLEYEPSERISLSELLELLDLEDYQKVFFTFDITNDEQEFIYTKLSGQENSFRPNLNNLLEEEIQTIYLLQNYLSL